MDKRQMDKDPQIDAMLKKARLYRDMADDLRAQAAKQIYERERGTMHDKPAALGDQP